MNFFTKKKTLIFLTALFIFILIFSFKKNNLSEHFYLKNKNKYELNMALNVRLSFKDPISFQENIKKIDNSYYLNSIFSEKKKNYLIKSQKKNNFNDIKKIWDTNMQTKTFIESPPIICDSNLYYATPEGSVVKINYETGDQLWVNNFKNSYPLAKRGFTCEYVDKLSKYVLFIPTAKGVLCVDTDKGSLINNLCQNGILGSKRTLIKPEIFGEQIFIATVNPSGVESYNYITGKFLWRTEFEDKILGGSNPWSGFILDKNYLNILVNTGSPHDWPGYNLDNIYKNSNSLIAIDIFSGKIKWSFKELSKDYWDHDLVGRPILLEKKINNVDVVVTLSKSGNIYFVDRNSGKLIFNYRNNKIKVGDLDYNLYSSENSNLLDTDYYNYKNFNFTKTINTFDDHTKGSKNKNYFYGNFPPILKSTRIFDGYSGGPQWPGATFDNINDLIIIPSNRNLLIENYYDFKLKKNDKTNADLSLDLKNKCLSCHQSTGIIKKDGIIVPSLFLISKIFSRTELDNFYAKNLYHRNIKISLNEKEKIYNFLSKYDQENIKNNNYERVEEFNYLDFMDETNALNLSPFGLITAISTKTGSIIWQIPAGSYVLKNGKNIFGSPNFGGVSFGNYKDGVIFFTGSYDKKVYAIDSNNGDYIWETELPASGSAPPLVYTINKERWIFIVATGGRVDKSNKLIAFKQNLSE